jgi:pyrroline-5-carboxylate reductase
MVGNVVLVGCGNMGFAMLKGWLDAGILQSDQVTVVEPAPALLERAATLGVNTTADASGIKDEPAPRIILVAVKPQVMRDVLPAYARFKDTSTFVSVAAGIKVAFFEEHLGSGAAIIRTIPNTPAAIGKGMIVTFRNANVKESDADFANRLLETSGAVAAVDDESLIDAATAVSGSGPAYVFHFIEALTEAAVDAGLERKTAEILAMQTVSGAGALAAASEDTPTRLREQVTSPKGTTAAALDVLMGGDRLKKLMSEAVSAAHKRAVELGSQA